LIFLFSSPLRALVRTSLADFVSVLRRVID
jgi:hypothetical protein